VHQSRNEKLKSLMTEAGCSYEGLALRVNTLGAQHGLQLSYDKSSVSHWVNGKRPRSPVPFLIAEILGMKLGRSVSLDEIGLGTTSEAGLATESLLHHSDLRKALSVMDRLGRADMDRRNFLYLLPFSLSAVPGTQRDWLLHLLSLNDEPPRTCRSTDVENIRRSMQMFTAIDVQFGGNQAREALAAYVTNDVVPLLRSSRTEKVEHQLFSAAAEIYLQLGWMTFDVGADGLAQRYLTQGLHLARRSDRSGLVVASHLLAALGQIAYANDRLTEGLNFARTALHTAQGADSPRATTRARMVEARALSGLADGKGAATAMSAAEAAADRAGDDPEWTHFIDTGYLASQMAGCFRVLDDPTKLMHFTRLSVGTHSPTGRQAAANSVYMATARLRLGDVEAACAEADQAAEMASRMKSAMTGRLIRQLTGEMRASPPHPRIAHFLAAHSSI
jgi:hypothetical protein